MSIAKPWYLYLDEKGQLIMACLLKNELKDNGAC